MEKSPEELYQERSKRVHDAIELREPDRVSFYTVHHIFPCHIYGPDLSGSHGRSGRLDRETRFSLACSRHPL
jgi:hypothetical protein